MRLEEMPDHGDWVKLAEEPEREIVFGAIGRFWGSRDRLGADRGR